MTRMLPALLLLACGCRQLWGLGRTPDLEADASVITDGPPIDGVLDARQCFGSFGVAPYCLQQLPVASFDVLQAIQINTASNDACMPQFPEQCVITGSSIQIDAKLSVTGSLPLVLIATGGLRVGLGGSIDVASHHNGTAGPGANFVDCDNGMNAQDAGGGQGGSFGGKGGDGGKQNGSPGGRAGATAMPTTLRGGCKGATGGDVGGAGGNGGGAVYLIAATDVTISGSVDASGGAGNQGSGNIRGGGGAGSGGMIVIEAPAIVVDNGVVFANGGGGGGGASLGAPGTAGSDPSDLNAASGGNGGGTAGDGGSGSGVVTPDGSIGSESTTDGGGGGGGGAGVIKTIDGSITNLAAVSPQPS